MPVAIAGPTATSTRPAAGSPSCASGTPPTAEAVNEIVVLDTSGELEPSVVVTGPTSSPTPASRPTAPASAGCSGTTPTCRGTAPSCASPPVEVAADGPRLGAAEVVAGRPHWAGDVAPAAPTASRCPSRAGTPTGRCGSCPTAPAGGTSTAGRRPATVEPRRRRWRPRSACRSGCSASRGTPSLPTTASSSPTGATASTTSLGASAATASVTDLDLPYTSIASVQAAGDQVVFVGASATAESAVVSVRSATSRPSVDVLRPPRDLGLDPAWFSVPEAISFPTSGGPHRPRAVLPADQPGGRPRRRASARRCSSLIHGGPTSAARPIAPARHPVLDQPRLRRRRRQLRRLDRLRPRVPATSSTAAGASSTSTTASAAAAVAGRRRAGSTPTGCASAAARPAATRRSPRWPSATRSPPAPATTASPTSRRWRPTPTSSRAATSTAWSGRTRSARDVYVERSPIHHVDGLRPPADRAPGPARTRSCRRTSPR